MLLLAVVLLAALWELYKLVIPADGVRVGDALILPRSDDTSMPHLSQIFGAFGKQEVAGASGTVLSSVISAVWYSLRLAAAGFAVGVVVGFLLALAMQRLRIVERALLPYVVLSQTVPLAPATSCLPKAPKICDRCGIDVSSLRGRMSASPTRTPSAGMTSL